MDRWSFLGLWASATLALGCLNPTQVTVDLSTNVECEKFEAGIFAGESGKDPTEKRGVATTTRACTPAEPNNKIGSIVFVPSADKNALFSIVAVAGVNDKPAEQCVEHHYDSCIVARRALRFVPHTMLTLPITLHAQCAGVDCGDTSKTCVLSPENVPICVSAEIKDPDRCAEPGACGEDALSGGGGAGSTSSSGGVGGAGGSNAAGATGTGTGTGTGSGGGTTIEAPCGQLALGSDHSCAVEFATGQVSCWGANSIGELGIGVLSSAPQPAAQPTFMKATRVASCKSHTCAIADGGAVDCWGLNLDGQLGSTDMTNVPTPVVGLTSIKKVATGHYHSCAIDSAGSVLCWGTNINGQLGDPSALGGPTPVKVKEITAASDIALGSRHTCVVQEDQTVWCWGANGSGQTGAPTTSPSITTPFQVDLSGATQIAAGGFGDAGSGAQSCALQGNSGKVLCWGDNTYSQLGDPDALGGPTPVAVRDLGDAIEIAMGRYHLCARRQNGAVVCWGRNESGQLGNGGMDTSALPVPVYLPGRATDIACGGNHSCALLEGGALYCWGSNDAGQLGVDPGVSLPATMSLPIKSDVTVCH